jgi:peptide/nickel transport system ATP-binding protein
VIYQGRIVEQGSPETLFHNAAHPYTRALLEAVPRMEPATVGQARRRVVPIAPRVHPASACPYALRCPKAEAQCDASRPELRRLTMGQNGGHQVACHLA